MPFNNRRRWRLPLAALGDEMACLVGSWSRAGKHGVVPPRPGFLEMLGKPRGERGILLIFDEVISGFRVAWGGWQTVRGTSLRT